MLFYREERARYVTVETEGGSGKGVCSGMLHIFVGTSTHYLQRMPSFVLRPFNHDIVPLSLGNDDVTPRMEEIPSSCYWTSRRTCSMLPSTNRKKYRAIGLDT